MIEYLHNAIRATAGTSIAITAEITDSSGLPIEEDCELWLHDSDSMLAEVPGTYLGEGEWTFQISPSITEGLCGRYWYCIRHSGDMLCFKEPIYLI